MKQSVSCPWNTLFDPNSSCFMSMKHCFVLIQGASRPRNKIFHPDSTRFTVFLDHETNCFIADSCRFNIFHHCFIAQIHPVSYHFNLFHHCFTNENERLDPSIMTSVALWRYRRGTMQCRRTISGMWGPIFTQLVLSDSGDDSRSISGADDELPPGVAARGRFRKALNFSSFPADEKTFCFLHSSSLELYIRLEWHVRRPFLEMGRITWVAISFQWNNRRQKFLKL